MFEEVFDNEKEYSTIAIDNCDFFKDLIIERGEDYYLNGKVKNLTKMGNVFVSEVEGTNDYTVRVVIDDDGDSQEVLMSCDCPYEDNCKHEYATLLAIQEGEYNEKELKPYIKEKKLTLEQLIKKIPAEALKKYILSDRGSKNTSFCINDLEKTFVEYIPKQEYNYFYNNLYNSYLLKDNFEDLYDSYYQEIRYLIDSEDYLQAFYIIKAIIEVTHDLDLDIIDDYPELGMYFRIAYRKGSREIKLDIEKYIMSLIFNQYYNNCYLEDIILSIN